MLFKDATGFPGHHYWWSDSTSPRRQKRQGDGALSPTLPRSPGSIG